MPFNMFLQIALLVILFSWAMLLVAWFAIRFYKIEIIEPAYERQNQLLKDVSEWDSAESDETQMFHE